MKGTFGRVRRECAAACRGDGPGLEAFPALLHGEHLTINSGTENFPIQLFEKDIEIAM
jgi:hypothetical protein